MKEEIKLINLKNEYDLCIIGVYAAGGVASYIYQLWRYLNKKGINTLLVTDFNELNIKPKSDAIDVKQGHFELIKHLLKVLEKINIKNIYVVQIDTIPYFLPLIEKYPSFLHIEYWPHELPLVISQLDSFYPSFERDFLSNPGRIRNCWEELIEEPIDFGDRWYNKNYLNCYWQSLYYADFIGLWMENDLKIWKSLFNNTVVDPKKLVFLPPMIDTQMFDGNKKNYRKIKIIINGKKTYQYNFLRTLKILQACFPKQEILVTGINSLAQYCYEGINTSQFNCLGFVPYDKVHENYRLANVYALLSESHEGFSVSTLEAMASGCVPVVSTFVADNMGNNVIIHGKTGFIVGNDDELKDVFKTLSEDPIKLKEIGMNARKIIETKYSFHKNLKHYKFFKDLLGR